MKKFDSIKRIGKKIYGEIHDIGVVKGIGFIPNDEFYIDVNTYVFGFKVKTTRYWDEKELLARKKKNRVIVKGFSK